MTTELGFNVFANDRAGRTFMQLAGKVDYLEKKLSALDRKNVNVTVDIDDRGSSKLRSFIRNLDEANDRTATLVQTGAMLAPALVPLSAAAIPALAGLTTQLGVAAAAAGVTVTAFSGVGDALSAINKFKLDPSETNFAAMREELEKLGPAGQEFAFYLQSIRGDLQRLQDQAQAGLLPGAQEGIEELLELLPQLESMIGHLSFTAGDLLADAGDNLNDPRWVKFFDYIDRTAVPTLDNMGRTTGNLVESLANLMMAVDPLSQDFSTGLLAWSEGLVEASQNLDDSEGLQKLIDYVQDNGPQALETLGAFGNALLQLVEAAAPVGSVALPMLEGLADGFAALVDTPIGPILVGAAAAIGTVGRALAILRALGLRGGDSMLGKVFGGAVAPIKEASSALTTVTSAGERARMTATQHAEAEKKRAAAIRSGLASVGKGAALVGGLAVATSGLAEKTGLSNTASLALMGTIAGPWGAAIGGGVGLVMDLAAANNDLEAASERAEDAFDSQVLSMQAQQQALTDLQNELDTYKETLGDASSMSDSGFFERLKGNWTQLSDAFTDSADEQEKAVGRMRANQEQLRFGIAQVYAELNGGDMSMFTASMAELDQFVADVAPALQAAGIDIREAFTDGAVRPEAIAAIRAYVEQMDSAHGRSQAVADALRTLHGEMVPTATAAEQLGAALDNLFGPTLDQGAATDAWVVALKDMRAAIDELDGSLTGNSRAAITARDSMRSYVRTALDKVEADAAATGSGRQMAATLLETRDHIIAQAKAAGLNAGEIRKMVAQMGLTPKNLRTLIETPGVLTARQQVKALGRLYEMTPNQVRTLMSQPGMERSQAEIRALAKQYDLTPEQVRTFLEAVDRASPKIAAIDRRLDGLNGRTVRTYVQTIHTQVNARGSAGNFFGGTGYRPPGSAEGSTVPKDGGSYADRYPYLLAPGEEVISNRFGQADRHRDLLKAINANRLADGGTVPGFADGGEAVRRRIARRRERLADELAALRQALEGYGVTSILGRSPRNPTAAGMREEVNTLQRAVKEAGGAWTKHLERMTDRMIRDAKKIDVHERAIERETARRDRLNVKLAESEQALEQLQSTMAQFGSQVAGNFLGDPFNASRTVTVPGSVDPGLQRRLMEAEARLGQLRSSPVADSLAAAAEASALLPKIEAMRAEVERQSQPIERTISGLEMLRETLVQNTQDALAFTTALQTLSDWGLDAGLFADLAASGDLGTAEQLVAGGPAMVEEFNDLWLAREEAVAKLSAFTVQEVYSEQQTILLEQLRSQRSEVKESNRHLARLERGQDRLGDRIVAAQRETASAIGGQIAGLRRGINDLSRRDRDDTRARSRR